MTDKLTRYQEALLDMVNQHCHHPNGLRSYVHHEHLSANQGAIKLLEKDGILVRESDGWRIMRWDGVPEEAR